MVSRVLEENHIFPENTRIRKIADNRFQVLLASALGIVDTHSPEQTYRLPDGKNGSVTLVCGDYSDTCAG